MKGAQLVKINLYKQTKQNKGVKSKTKEKLPKENEH